MLGRADHCLKQLAPSRGVVWKADTKLQSVVFNLLAKLAHQFNRNGNVRSAAVVVAQPFQHVGFFVQPGGFQLPAIPGVVRLPKGDRFVAFLRVLQADDDVLAHEQCSMQNQASESSVAKNLVEIGRKLE